MKTTRFRKVSSFAAAIFALLGASGCGSDPVIMDGGGPRPDVAVSVDHNPSDDQGTTIITPDGGLSPDVTTVDADVPLDVVPPADTPVTPTDTGRPVCELGSPPAVYGMCSPRLPATMSIAPNLCPSICEHGLTIYSGGLRDNTWVTCETDTVYNVTYMTLNDILNGTFPAVGRMAVKYVDVTHATTALVWNNDCTQGHLETWAAGVDPMSGPGEVTTGYHVTPRD